jgi:hypothetical protein
VINFSLDVGDPAISSFAPSYGTVNVNRTDPIHATITFTSATNASGNVYMFGAAGSAGVNVNASSWTIGSFTSSNSGLGFTANAPGDITSGGAGNEDGFGSFNQIVNTFDSYGHASTTLSFVLTDTSGSWASASNVLTPNASGNTAAALIFVSPTANFSEAVAIGFASGAGGTSSVPEPMSFALLGTALVGIGLVTRRRA